MHEEFKPRMDREFWNFGLLFFFFNVYMCVWQTFFPIYYRSLDMTSQQIGVLTAIGPAVNLFVPPIFGRWADRSKYKNSVLTFALIVCMLVSCLFMLGSGFYFIAIVAALFFAFNGPTDPIANAMALERASINGYSYGYMRIAGLSGYCVMSLVVGYIADINIDYIFGTLVLGIFLSVVMSYFLPKVKGHQREGKRVSVFAVLKDKRYLLYQSFNLMHFVTLGIYFAFFAVYLTDMGASKLIVGITQISGITFELVFMFFAAKITRRFKTEHVLLVLMGTTALRWLLTSQIQVPVILIFVNFLHFPCSAMGYMMSDYVNKSVIPELRASGQAFGTVANGGIARITGSLLGGALIRFIGYSNTFLCMSALCFCAFIVYSFIFTRLMKKART